MDGHVKIKRVRYNPTRGLWVADAEADNGFGYQQLLVSGASPGSITAYLERQYRKVTDETKFTQLGVTK